jgi:amino acid adenylation domain-containing protein
VPKLRSVQMNRSQYLSKENVASVWELSPLQKQAFQQMSGSGKENGNGCILRMAAVIRGCLDPDKIQEAWQLTVRQTPLLRTVFRNALNRTVQVVLKEWPDQVEIAEQAPSFILKPPGSEKINLMEDTAVKMKLFRDTGETATLFLTGHSIITDRKSLLSIFKDFLAAYESIDNGGNYTATRRAPFKNYLDWLARQYWVPALAHWEKELADFQSPSSLVRYHSFPTDKCTAYLSRTQTLPEELSRGLENLSQQYEVSPAVVVQAAWVLLLHLYSHEKKVIFGVETQGVPENTGDLQNIIGPFSNILPLMITVDLKQSLQGLIFKIREKNEILLRDSFIPLEKIKTESGLEPRLKLFESSVSVMGVGAGDGEETPSNRGWCSGNLELQDMDFWEERDHRFALDVTTGKQWRMKFSCFDGGIPEDFSLEVLDRLAALLKQVQKNPDTKLYKLDFLSGSDAEKLSIWNRPGTAEIPPHTLEPLMPGVFENQVEKTPTAIACTWRDQQVTFRELNIRANRLAHWLREEGIGPNRLAGIFTERGIGMLTAILAVFKAGGAYIPLDPGNPDSRLKTVIADSIVRVIFTQQEQTQRARELVKDLALPAAVFCLTPPPGDHGIANTAWLEDYPRENPPPTHGPRDLAYVLYTSGSTGVPKGAMVEHIGMLNHLWTKIKLLSLTSADKVAQNASHCFDISVWQFLAALIKGGQTVIYDNEVAMEPVSLLESVGKHGVSILEMVPAVMEMILNEVPAETKVARLSAPRYLISTGEALPTALCRRWTETYPHIPVVNAYGPTECSDDTHHKVISAAPGLEEFYNDVPLGKIIPNFKCYILNEEMQFLPPGCPGEMCLTGIGVGKGYLNNPERTAASFVKNPCADGMGDRMYRTGDLGYFNHQGEMVFLGRIDYQVKIRGHRIELGEIETRWEKSKHG